MPDWAFALAFIGGIVVAVFLFAGGVVTVGTRVSRHYDHIACTNFGKQSNREVKFVSYTFWSWDCLTPTADGKWISTKNLREFGTQP